MMRVVFPLLLSALVAGCAPGSGSSTDADAADLLVRWQFAGTARLAGDTNGTALRAVLAEPATRALVAHTLERLAAAPVTKPLAPFLNDLLQFESLVQARGRPERPEWTLAVRVPPERAAVWLSTWTNAAAAWERARTPVVRAGDWIVAGVGEEPLTGFEAVRARLGKSGRPGVHHEPGAWLEAEAHLARLAPALGLPTNVTWPRVHLALAGQGADVRTVGRLLYDRPLELPLEPWRIPTNTIREPLISFAALQGVRPWLAAHSLVRELELPAPNQIFGWARSLAPYLTQFAWELPDAATRLPALQTRLAAALRARLPWLDFGELQLVPGLTRLVWTGFPMLVPFIAPAPDPGFVTAGIFPVTGPESPPAPPALYQQLLGRTNLVFYHWEITQPRLADWRELHVLHDMVAGHAPPPTNTPAVLWLQATNVVRHLGNAVTEVTRTGPRELTLVRRSALGLTAFEIHWVTRWLDGRRFPLLSPPVRILGVPRPATAGGGATNAPANHAQTGRQH
jgi:hypothetical protein